VIDVGFLTSLDPGAAVTGIRAGMEDKRNTIDEDQPTEDDPGEPGAEGGSGSDAADRLPGAPSHDDSALGDTDQHSEG
jgi:hypothetical protein